MRIVSNSFKLSNNNQLHIPSKYTCDGANINPHLVWSDVPAGAQSFVLMIDDPDAPSEVWCHVLIYNIPATVHEIGEGALTTMKWNLGYNSWDKREYGGPCPPSGVHRYIFHLYALDRMLDESATRKWNRVSFLRYIQEEHPEQLIDTAEMIAVYQRN
jgi:Raf kinase inhibitor-like YbhB/YbcL family protein